VTGSIAGSVVVGAYLGVPNPVFFENPEEEALRHLGKAVYIELDLDQYVKRAEKKYVPRWVYTYGPYVAPVVQIATEGRVTYTWRF
jgi:hypothetical protein